MLLSIDPGLRKVGWALWKEPGNLAHCGLAQAPGRDRDARQWVKMADATHAEIERWAEKIKAVAYEMPQVYSERDNQALRKKTGSALTNAKNPDNLLQLVGVLGAVLLPLGHCRLIGYRPRQWKKAGERKATSHYKLRDRLTLTELSIMDSALRGVPSGCRHDVMDAIAIGAHALRRGPR